MPSRQVQSPDDEGNRPPDTDSTTRTHGEVAGLAQQGSRRHQQQPTQLRGQQSSSALTTA